MQIATSNVYHSRSRCIAVGKETALQSVWRVRKKKSNVLEDFFQHMYSHVILTVP
jgi:hypothetical protein